MKKRIRFHVDVYIGIGLLIICAVVFNLSLAMRSGARTLPLALSAFMGAMSVIIILKGFKQSIKEGTTKEAQLAVQIRKKTFAR